MLSRSLQRGGNELTDCLRSRNCIHSSVFLLDELISTRINSFIAYDGYIARSPEIAISNGDISFESSWRYFSERS